ncbi:MAG: DinB family protein [Pirellulales bacterium]|nr:DinB family protein [Pirellulales bacterium]
MDLKAHARFSLQKSRNLAERLLDDFKTREDWLFQPHSKANHALWITAHIALADNQFGAVFRPDSARKPDGWDEWFWFGSQLREDTGVYPDHEEVYAYYQNRRETLLEVLDELTVDELSGPAPEAAGQGPLAGAPSMGFAFFFIAYHEGVHTGQLTVVHRALGNAPLFEPQS